MQRRTLGENSGVEVSVIGLGAMPLSLSDKPGEAEGIRVIHAALDAGMTLIDTADVYCVDERDMGANERLIREALARWPRRAEVVVATKGGLVRPGGAWISRANARHLRAACEASLRALGVEAITLYQLHAPDDDVPLEESVGALAELRREGKIVNVGLSNVNAGELARARAIVPIVSVQNRLSVMDRGDLRSGLVDLCAQEGIVYLAYGPVGGGHGKRRVAADPTLSAIAAARCVSNFQVALAWLLARSPAILPIPGASRAASAADSAGAAALRLSEAELAELAAAFPG